jgi:hypothetical protein
VTDIDAFLSELTDIVADTWNSQSAEEQFDAYRTQVLKAWTAEGSLVAVRAELEASKSKCDGLVVQRDFEWSERKRHREGRQIAEAEVARLTVELEDARQALEAATEIVREV